jgi:acyl-CoA synthetase (NDP forming)
VGAAVRRAAATRPDKPVVGIFMAAKGAPPQLSPIPCYQFPEAAAVALARAAEYGAWRAQPVSATPLFDDANHERIRSVVDHALERGGGWLTPAEAEALLGGLGIGVAAQEVVPSEDDAVRAADRMGYPIVMKAVGARIVHKTELGAVIVGLEDAAAVRDAWRDLSTRLGAMMTGALVQEMVTGGVEMLVGAVEDPTFGRRGRRDRRHERGPVRRRPVPPASADGSGREGHDRRLAGRGVAARLPRRGTGR